MRVDNAKLAGIRAVTLDLDQSMSPVLRIQFEHPVAFIVAQDKRFRKHSGRNFAEGFDRHHASRWMRDQIGGAAQAVPGRKAGAVEGAVSGPDKGKSGGKISQEDLKIVEASMDEARAAMKSGKFEEAVRLLRKVLKFPENKYSAEAQELIGRSTAKGRSYGRCACRV